MPRGFFFFEQQGRASKIVTLAGSFLQAVAHALQTESEVGSETSVASAGIAGAVQPRCSARAHGGSSVFISVMRAEAPATGLLSVRLR